MILGAGVYQYPLILKAKEMGYSTVVVSPIGDYPGLAIADYVVDLDTRNKEKILEYAIKYDIVGIVTTGTDVAVPTLGYIVDELDLYGPSFKAAERSMNKYLMKQCFEKSGVKTAKYFCVTSKHELFDVGKLIKYPVMVKAVDSSGSRGITKVARLFDIEEAYDSAKEVSNVNEVVVEEFIKGEELGAQVLVKGDKVVDVFIHNDFVTAPPICVPIGHSMPVALTKEVQARVYEEVIKAVKALGLINVVANVDFIISEGEVYILEVGARMGATCLPENIGIYHEINLYQAIIELAVAGDCQYKLNKIKKPNAVFLVTSDSSGVIDSIDVDYSAIPNEIGFKLDFDVKEGDKVNAFKVGPDRIGQLITQAENEAKAVENAKLILNTINIVLR